MGWLSRLLGADSGARGGAGDRAGETDEDDLAPALFVCTTCGRTDLPEAGDWDPPVCLECDAAINEDALIETGIYDDL